uniref:IGF-like family receptor 1 n=1 Tax=Nothobranchius furzeri TaxID=105023 RepID=A0A8C6M3D5_NOTFU
MVYSEMCGNSSTYWNGKECVPCDVKPGMIILYSFWHDVTPNCGRNDHGGYHDDAHTKCKPNTFNDGSGPYCRNCSSCKPGNFIEKNCTTTTDTIMRLQKFLLLFVRKRHFALSCFFLLSSAAIFESNTSLCCPLDENIRSAPLQTVLDNLDVLEELVILLDPDTRGLKNTKHLASHCSFPSTWITYTYSMKDSKSPLRAVLEGLTSRNPDWTVGHLAKLLRQIDRNDAVVVLAKLKPSPHVQLVL